MVALNLTKHKDIVNLLNHLIAQVSKVSLHDRALLSKLDDLKLLLQDPSNIDFNSLNYALTKLANILGGYEVDKSIPTAFFHLLHELERIKMETEIRNKHFAKAELQESINQFHKLATSKI